MNEYNGLANEKCRKYKKNIYLSKMKTSLLLQFAVGILCLPYSMGCRANSETLETPTNVAISENKESTCTSI